MRFVATWSNRKSFMAMLRVKPKTHPSSKKPSKDIFKVMFMLLLKAKAKNHRSRPEPDAWTDESD